MERWPHQISGVKAILDALFADVKRVILQSPTGGGKSVMMQDLIAEFLNRGMKVVLYSNRKMLIEQLSGNLMEAGFYHGVRAAGYEDEREHPLQISSIQTEVQRSLKRKQWELHKANLVIVDEGHLHGGDKYQQVLNHHLEQGAYLVYFTATPLDMKGMADKLIVAGTNSQLRECGALVRAKVVAPSEPDFKGFKKLLAKLENGEDGTAAEIAQLMDPPKLFGRIFEHYNRLNPEREPGLLFAGGVEQSLWFAQKFTENGVRAAHIDGDDIWLDGELHKADHELRRHLLTESKAGNLPMICNRFVLREGIDAPWLSHGILATVFGSLGTYLQSVGRLLRKYPWLDWVTIQDHGGNYWRHGSPNADRDWKMDRTSTQAYDIRAEAIRSKKCQRCKAHLHEGNPVCPKCSFLNEIQPTVCQRCFMVLVCGKCTECGFEPRSPKRARAVMTTDGQMKVIEEDAFPQRKLYRQLDGIGKWKEMYFRSKNYKKGRTFRAAIGLFAYENWGQYPDPQWPLMPIDPLDRFQLVCNVPVERLTKG